MGIVDGKTRVCGIIANPVEHTLSPVLHNTLAKEMKHNLVYVPFKPEKDGVDAAVKGAYALNVLGMNVSVPYKQEVMKSLAEIDKGAKEIGAVNTLVRTDSGYKGYNTDYLGLWRAFEEEKISLKGQKVIVLGAGGASKAVNYLCCTKGAERVYLLNRSLGKAQETAEELNGYIGRDCIQAMQIAEYKKIPYEEKGYLAIQTTSVGMYPDTEHAVIEEEEFYAYLHTAFDIIYTPAKTKFMQLAEAGGAKVYNGLKMLLYQGIIAYELWNDTKISDEIVSKVSYVMEKELLDR